MSQSFLIQQYTFSRHITLATLESTTETLADVIPETSTNNIRWHLGHILVSTDMLLFGKIDEASSGIPQHYLSLFFVDTSPANWKNENVPTLTELRELLTSQIERVQVFDKKIEEPLPQPFTVQGHTINTFGQMLSFITWHEGYHHGFINGLKRAVGEKNLWPSQKA
ncbi:DinB family protein [Marininema halotolerans]|uniref:DinB superfamily protein n=1 Tax=Marininema halotolerans TaxID=1155944 RepID=A0A1I6QPD3_9BACL|nr:DinB family protein [Marininema halotolerans]SFS54220.1 DinB superfamily protein [Marininema halotolerans]